MNYKHSDLLAVSPLPLLSFRFSYSTFISSESWFIYFSYWCMLFNLWLVLMELSMCFFVLALDGLELLASSREKLLPLAHSPIYPF